MLAAASHCSDSTKNSLNLGLCDHSMGELWVLLNLRILLILSMSSSPKIWMLFFDPFYLSAIFIPNSPSSKDTDKSFSFLST